MFVRAPHRPPPHPPRHAPLLPSAINISVSCYDISFHQLNHITPPKSSSKCEILLTSFYNQCYCYSPPPFFSFQRIANVLLAIHTNRGPSNEKMSWQFSLPPPPPPPASSISFLYRVLIQSKSFSYNS